MKLLCPVRGLLQACLVMTMTPLCAVASFGADRPAGASGWSRQRQIVSGRISRVGDTTDSGSRMACSRLRDALGELAGAQVERCEAISLSLVNHGRRMRIYDLFVITALPPDDGSAGSPLWDAFVPSINSGTPSCGRYEIFVYRRGREEIRTLGEPLEERSC